MAKKKDVVQRRITTLIVAGILTTFFGLVTVFALIQNSKEAKKRYDALIAVDAAGGDVETALRELREFVYGHMNTSIGSSTGVYPPIQLKGTYERLVAAEQQRIVGNSTLYDEAQKHCEALYPSGQLRSNRVPCVADYISTHGGNTEQVYIPEGLYKFDFVSPRWSPDLAGFALLATIISGSILLINAAILFHYRSVIRKSL